MDEPFENSTNNLADAIGGGFPMEIQNQGLSVIREYQAQAADYENVMVDPVQHQYDMNRAYAMIAWYDPSQGKEWNVYYMRTLHIDIGRRGKQPSAVDLQVTQDKTMSRVHMRIQWDMAMGGFYLHVYGKNGLILDGRTRARDSEPAALRHGSRIEVGDVVLEFRLPNNQPEASYTTYDAPPLPLQPQSHMQNQTQISQYDSESDDAPRKRYRASRDSSATEVIKSTKTSPMGKSRNASPYSKSTPRKPTKEDDEYHEAAPKPKTSAPRSATRPNKPSLSYVQMIQEAINSSPNRQMSLAGIYRYISDTWPYYDMASNSWQNTVRHNLSVSSIFKRIPKDGQQPGPDGKIGKGALWVIVPEEPPEQSS